MTDISLFDIDKALSSVPLGRTRVYVRQVWNSAFLKAQKLGIVDKNILTLTDRISYKKRKSRALTLTEQSVFLNKLKGRKAEYVMQFYLHTGVRRAEALSLLYEDIDRKERLILIRGTKTNNSERLIVMTDEVEKIIDNLQRRFFHSFILLLAKTKAKRCFLSVSFHL